MKKILFALPGNEALTKQLTELMDADSGEMLIRKFPDGETYVRILTDVKDRELVLVCTLNQPDEKLLPLYFVSATLRSLGAKQIDLIAPYLAYMRQDTVFNTGEGVTSAYFASIISNLADRLITIDPHLHRRTSMGEIYSIPSKVIHASSLISDYIRHSVDKPVLIGPDEESRQWVAEVAKNTGAPYIILEKIRSGDRDVKVSAPDLDKYQQHTPVLVDDIISTARTMMETVAQLKSIGMKAPVCIGVHGIFAGNAYNDLVEAGAERIVTTNTIPHESNQIEIAALIAHSFKLTPSEK